MDIDSAFAVISAEDLLKGPFHVNTRIKEQIENIKTYYWAQVPAEGRPELTMREFILRLLKTEARPLTIDEIADAFEEAGYDTVRHSVRGRLNELTSQGRILRVARATYASFDHSAEDDDDAEADGTSPPEIPDQDEGLAFAISPNGRIGFAATGLVSDDDDIARIEAMRVVLVQVVDDLIAATTGSNAFASVCRVAQHYRAALEGEIGAISIDQLYAQGIRLDNANARLKQEIARGDLPDTGLVVGEALDSVLAIHGPTVLTTTRGQQLLELSSQYNVSRQEELEYKERATAFGAAIANSQDLVERDAKETIEVLNKEIGEGRFPERSSDNARRANRNLLATIARVVLAGTGTVVAGGLIVSEPAVFLSGTVTELANVAWSFLLTHNHELRLLAAAAGQELSWLTAFLDWLERQKKR